MHGKTFLRSIPTHATHVRFLNTPESWISEYDVVQYQPFQLQSSHSEFAGCRGSHCLCCLYGCISISHLLPHLLSTIRGLLAASNPTVAIACRVHSPQHHNRHTPFSSSTNNQIRLPHATGYAMTCTLQGAWGALHMQQTAALWHYNRPLITHRHKKQPMYPTDTAKGI